MTNDAWRFTPTAEVLPKGEDPRDPDVAAHLLRRGYLPLHEGKTFRQYDDHWGERPSYVVRLLEAAGQTWVLPTNNAFPPVLSGYRWTWRRECFNLRHTDTVHRHG